MNIVHVGEIIEHKPVYNEMEELYITPKLQSLRKSTSIDIYIPEHYSSNDVKNVLISTGLSEDFIEDVIHSFPTVPKLEIKPIVEVNEQERYSNELMYKSPKKSPKKKRNFFFKLYKGMVCFNNTK
jgi:hypothetical protein